MAHPNDWGKIAFGMIGSYPSERVAVKGNCSEICRCFHYKNGKHPLIESPDQIIELERGWQELPFACASISDWYDKAKSVAETTKVDLLDLFYWEHRMGSWQAQGQLEWDMVQEVYTPFNHRGLLETMLSAPARYRCFPHTDLYEKLCKALWSDVLKESVNPPEKRAKLNNFLRRFGLEGIVKSVYAYFFKKAHKLLFMGFRG